MARRKKDNEDEIEILEQEIRALKSENRHLKKELKKSNKNYKPDHDQSDLIEEDYSSKKQKCEECGKGEIIITDLGVRKLIHCTVCKNRKTIKTNG
jgi:formamidopyrimidine-DNA glycosylase